MKKFFYLDDRAVLSLKGKDKEPFLQGLITNDIAKVNIKPIYAMMLTPQGKFLYDFFIKKFEDIFLLDIPYDRKNEIIKKLMMYKLRADVTIEDVSEHFKVYATFDKANDDFFPDPRNEHLSYRAITDKALPFNDNNDEFEYKRIALKIPDAQKDFIYEKSFPLELEALKLHAIDFDKGCYIGQEVTARTYYQGVIRKKLYVLQCTNDESPSKGEEIFNENIKVGIALGFYNNLGLGLLKTEEVKNLSKPSLKTQNALLQILS